MKRIEITVTVTDEQQIKITLPSDITSSKHRVVVVIDENPLIPDKDTAKPLLKLNVGHVTVLSAEKMRRITIDC